MNAVSGAFQSVSNGVGSLVGAPKVNVPPQGNVPPAPPAQTGGRRRNRKNNTLMRKNRRNGNLVMRKNRRNGNVVTRKNRKNRTERKNRKNRNRRN